MSHVTVHNYYDAPPVVSLADFGPPLVAVLGVVALIFLITLFVIALVGDSSMRERRRKFRAF